MCWPRLDRPRRLNAIGLHLSGSLSMVLYYSFCHVFLWFHIVLLCFPIVLYSFAMSFLWCYIVSLCFLMVLYSLAMFSYDIIKIFYVFPW